MEMLPLFEKLFAEWEKRHNGLADRNWLTLHKMPPP